MVKFRYKAIVVTFKNRTSVDLRILLRILSVFIHNKRYFYVEKIQQNIYIYISLPPRKSK